MLAVREMNPLMSHEGPLKSSVPHISNYEGERKKMYKKKRTRD
jgi:hypothetical protein